MRLLIWTQKVDASDPVLGFFCLWINALAKEYEEVKVVCLEKGTYSFPKNVTVYSLGKEKGFGRLTYIKNAYSYIYKFSHQYDAVFVHMNQEYVLLGGLYWKIKSIPVYLWRNHPYGNLSTCLAVLLSTKVFCTSKESFTSRFTKTTIMPVGVDTGVFKPTVGTVRMKHSICMVGRISEVKKIDLCLRTVKKMIDNGVHVSLTIVGSVLPKDILYYESLKKYFEDNKLSFYVQFVDSVPFNKLPEIYSSHEICLNLTSSGSFDKTIVEASSCGAIPVVSNTSLRGLLPESCITENTEEGIAYAIQNVLSAPVHGDVQSALQKFVQSQSLQKLVERLKKEIV